tara:strand:+ start:451 stop:615 length:165 start_codon:yes stop_codon:yes gene_type:complete
MKALKLVIILSILTSLNVSAENEICRFYVSETVFIEGKMVNGFCRIVENKPNVD